MIILSEVMAHITFSTGFKLPWQQFLAPPISFHVCNEPTKLFFYCFSCTTYCWWGGSPVPMLLAAVYYTSIALVFIFLLTKQMFQIGPKHFLELHNDVLIRFAKWFWSIILSVRTMSILNLIGVHLVSLLFTILL